MALIIALALGAIATGVAKKAGLLDPEAAKSAAGLLFGLMMVLAANLIPKTMPPLSARRGRVALGITIERDAGWILVLGGITTILIWLTAPAGVAMLAAPLVGLLAFALVAANAGLLAWRERHVEKTERETVMAGDTKRRTLRLLSFIFLWTLAWVFAIFVVDARLGDEAAQWTAVIFVIVNGVVMAIGTTGLALRKGRAD